MTPAEADVLLDLAEATLAAAVRGRRAQLPPLDALPDTLHTHVGAFVTLLVGGRLNGCIGDVDGREPLADAIPRLALAAAFDDPRLPALRRADLRHLTVEISLLSALEPIDVGSRADLAAALRPGHDGLVIAADGRRGLFLPSVWSQLPEVDDFLDQLWFKAGLIPGAWPLDLRAFRFHTDRFSRHAR